MQGLAAESNKLPLIRQSLETRALVAALSKLAKEFAHYTPQS